jgi:hypothetical protein
MHRCLKAIGCNKDTVENTCRKDSPLCVMCFKGFIVLGAALGAIVIALSQFFKFNERYTAATARGDAYS